jgi:hypothetical protein
VAALLGVAFFLGHHECIEFLCRDVGMDREAAEATVALLRTMPNE